MSFYFYFIFQTISNQQKFSCPINFILFSVKPCKPSTILLSILTHMFHHPPVHPNSYVPPSSNPSQFICSTILQSILTHMFHHPPIHPSSSVLHPPVHPSQLIRPTSTCTSQLIRPTILLSILAHPPHHLLRKYLCNQNIITSDGVRVWKTMQHSWS